MIKDLEIKENVLTDGSKTYDVHFTPMVAAGDKRHKITFYCLDEKAAQTLVRALDESVSGIAVDAA